MSENSKTTMEIFEKKYPIEEIKGHPLLISEAYGYLKAIEEYNPTLEKAIEHKKALLMLLLLTNL